MERPTEYAKSDFKGVLPGTVFALITCTTFLFLVVYSLFWVCIHRKIRPNKGALKFKHARERKNRVEMNFRKRVFNIMKEKEREEEEEKEKKEKERRTEEGVQRILEGIERGKDEIRQIKIRRGATAMDENNDHADADKTNERTMKEQKRMKKEEQAEAKKKCKSDMKEARKKKKEDESALKARFKEEWGAAKADVNEIEWNRARMQTRNERRRRPVPCIY
ncbi:hypothetical protein TWF281_004305 [Arthrobotrys megalospora]